MLSHDEFDKKMTEAARQGENLFIVLNEAADHFLDCQKCQKNIAEIAEFVFLEAELKQDYEIDSADLSQEEVGTLLQFPFFDLSFLSGTPTSPEVPALRTDNQIESSQYAGLAKAGYSDGSGKPKEFKEISHQGERIAHPTEIRSTSFSTAQFSSQRINPADQLIMDAATLEKDGNLAEAQFTYKNALTQLKPDDALRGDLDTKINELRHRIRSESRLDREAGAAQALEKNGMWHEAEDTYRRLAKEAVSPQRSEEFKRAAERCHAEVGIADLFDSGLRAYKTKDLVGAMNRLKRVIHQRPGYVRDGIVAEVLLAQVRKAWEVRLNQASMRGAREFRLILGSGFILVFLLVVGIWNSVVPRQPLLNEPTVTWISPVVLPLQPVVPPSGVLPVRTVIPMGTAVAKTTTPTVVSPRGP